MKVIVYVDGGMVIGARTADPELKDIDVEVFDYDNMMSDDYPIRTGKQLAEIVEKSEEAHPFIMTVDNTH